MRLVGRGAGLFVVIMYNLIGHFGCFRTNVTVIFVVAHRSDVYLVFS